MPLREELQELLDSKISLHDKKRFEVKLDVQLDGRRRAEEYSVEAYFFIPSSLGVDARSYPSVEFYGDIQNYIRFKTPVIGLRKLGDDAYDYSPFRRLDEAVEAILSGDRTEGQIVKAVHELKLLGCVVRSDVRDQVYFLLSELDRLAAANGGAQAELGPLEASAMSFLNELSFLLGKLRSIRPRVLDPILPARVRDAYSNLDEFVSLVVESYLTILFSRLAARPGLSKIEATLKDAIGAEQRHRHAMGFPSVLEPTADNEDFGRRRSMLKKYISSLLYLDMKVAERSPLREFVLSIVAAIAMLSYLMVVTLVQETHRFDSLIFILTAVLGYMMKDRMKDWLKQFFTESLAAWIIDHSADIIEPATGKVIGRFKEAVTFIRVKDVPEQVQRARGPSPGLDEDSGEEQVLKYVKRVRLYPSKIVEHHHRLKAINDILRFSVENFLGKMDDPKADYLVLNAERGELEGARIARTYPVDAVLRLAAEKDSGTETHLEKLRLILTRKGIKRLER